MAVAVVRVVDVVDFAIVVAADVVHVVSSSSSFDFHACFSFCASVFGFPCFRP